MKLKAMILASVFLACVARASAQDALPWSALPEADAVLVTDVSRLVNEGVPRLLSASPATLAKFNAGLDRMRNEDGIDLRAARSAAIAVRFAKASGPGLVCLFVGVDAAKMIANLNREHGKQYFIEEFQGRKIYVEKAPPKANGAESNSAPSSSFDLPLAVAELSSDAVAFGTPDEVRASIEALSGTKPRLDRKLIEAVQRHPSALLSFAVAATPKSASASGALNLLRLPQETGINNGVLDWLVSSVRVLAFAVAPTSGGMELATTVEMETEEQAEKLADMVASLKKLLALSKPDDETEQVLMDLVGNIRVSASGKEVIGHLDVPQSSIDYLVRRAVETTQAEPVSPSARNRSSQKVARRHK